jgi:hypothetical protein
LAYCSSTVFYTPSVVNAPHGIDSDIGHARDTLKDLARRPIRLEREEQLESIRQREKEYHETLLHKHDRLAEPFPELHRTYDEIAGEAAKEYNVKAMQVRDPTTLILIDEADRLRMAASNRCAQSSTPEKSA